jgi:hypothetical protein
MDIPGRIELGVGERWSASLPGLGSAGYEWAWEIEEGAGVVEVTLAPLSLPPMSPAGGEPPGSSNAEEQVEVCALRPGTARIHLSQRRRWEAGQPPLHKHVVVVTVG